MKMRRLCLVVLLSISCVRVTLRTNRNPATGQRILWPYTWAPERGPAIRGDALLAMQAALDAYLRNREDSYRAREGRCQDTARAMDVSYMVDEQQHLFFIRIDEAPEKRCPDNESVPIHLEDGGTEVVVVSHIIPSMVMDRVSTFAVTPEGQVLDALMPGEPENFHPYLDAGPILTDSRQPLDGGTLDTGMSDGGGSRDAASD